MLHILEIGLGDACYVRQACLILHYGRSYMDRFYSSMETNRSLNLGPEWEHFFVFGRNISDRRGSLRALGAIYFFRYTPTIGHGRFFVGLTPTGLQSVPFT